MYMSPDVRPQKSPTYMAKGTCPPPSDQLRLLFVKALTALVGYKVDLLLGLAALLGTRCATKMGLEARNPLPVQKDHCTSFGMAIHILRLVRMHCVWVQEHIKQKLDITNKMIP
ncbi:hypothetical protein EJB05_28455, partial [Eragrostis curvula]